MVEGGHGLRLLFVINQKPQTAEGRDHAENSENHPGSVSGIGHGEGTGVGDTNRKGKIVRRQLTFISGFVQQFVTLRGFCFRQAVLQSCPIPDCRLLRWSDSRLLHRDWSSRLGQWFLSRLWDTTGTPPHSIPAGRFYNKCWGQVFGAGQEE